MSGFIYDAGALIAADKNERSMWAEHRIRLEMGIVPSVPAPVLAQVSRSARQTQLRRFLAGCEVAPFSEADAHSAGAILAKARTSDVVDASVIVLAAVRGGTVVTSDPEDISRLAAAAGVTVGVVVVRR